MKRTRNKGECLEYVTCDVTIQVGFPKDMVICDICPFCKPENYGSRYRCELNSKILPYHSSTIGIDCPLPIKNQLDPPDQLPGQMDMNDY